MQKEEEITNGLFDHGHGVRMSADERRETILSAAVDLFSKHGFSGTTTKKIAKASGVSEAMVFRHFATKEELYGAILDEKACAGCPDKLPWEHDAPLAKAIADRDDKAFFYQLALTAMRMHQSDVPFMRLLMYSALEEHDLAARFFREFVSKGYEFIGGYIRSRQEEGAMRNVDPRVAVRAFMGMLIHHSLNNILWDKERRLLDISNEEAARNFAEIVLYGISKPAADKNNGAAERGSAEGI